MKYKYENIDEILNFKTWSDKQKIDTLLHINAILYSNLGTDSTKTEKEEVKKKSIDIFRKIKTIDKSRLIIFAPTNNCRIIEAVTIGPMPRCIMEPDAPAIINLYCSNKSITTSSNCIWVCMSSMPLGVHLKKSARSLHFAGAINRS